MVKLTLEQINERCRSDPAAFIQESEAEYAQMLRSVAEFVCTGHEQHPIVLLNGPSSSGKTTTARRLRDAMEQLGVHSHAISMDDYYQSRGSFDMPLDEEGNIDLESPLCMDLPLLSNHLAALSEGKEIQVPKYDFSTRSRTKETESVQLHKHEVAVIEGIHSFNSVIMGRLDGSAIGVYMSVGTQVEIAEDLSLAPHQLRFVRRAIRDSNFRSEPVKGTIQQWRSVRRGEKLYIHPYVPEASKIINTYLPYEDCVLMNLLSAQAKPYQDDMKQAELGELIRALDSFALISDYSAIPPQSIMHEFIG